LGVLLLYSAKVGITRAEVFFFIYGKIYFSATDSVNQNQVWISDGTAAGTVCPTPPSTSGETPFYPFQAWVPFNNAVYFQAAYSFWSDYQLCRYSENPSGIAQLPEENLAVYPNPTNGIFNVVLPKLTANARIEVYNTTGVLVHNQTAVNGINTIDLTNRVAGIYILKVLSNNKTIASLKIIKK